MCYNKDNERQKGAIKMNFKTQNEIAQIAFPQHSKEDFIVFNLPRVETRIMDLFANTNDLIKKIQVVKTLINYENEKFYASEIGLASGTITNLKTFNIIKETGETRKIMMPLGDGLFRECVAKQWELNVPKAKLQNVTNAIIEYLYKL